MLTRPRLPPISKFLAIPPDKLAATFATTSSVAAARLRLIKVSVYVPLESGLQQKKFAFVISKDSRIITRIDYYLRTEPTTATVDNASEGFIAAVRQNVSLQPSSGTRGPPLHFASLPLTDEIVAAGLRVDVRSLKEKIVHTIQIFDFIYLFFFSEKEERLM